jgi:hypothetical protein
METLKEEFKRFADYAIGKKEQFKITGGTPTIPLPPPPVELDEHGNPVPGKGNGGG